MSDEREIEVEPDAEARADEGLAAASDAYHEARLDAEGVTKTVEILDVVIGEELASLYVAFDDGEKTRWMEMESKAGRPRLDLLDRFDLSLDDGLAGLVESRVDVEVDLDDEVVRAESDGKRIGGLVPGLPNAEGRSPGEDSDEPVRWDAAPTDRPDWEGDRDAFERLYDVERALETGEIYAPTREVNLDADGDDERVRATVELDGRQFEWVFPVPSGDEFEDSKLREFVEAVGAGDPAGLDGHPVLVTLESSLWRGEERFVSECGHLAIVPRAEFEKSSEAAEEADGAGGRILDKPIVEYAFPLSVVGALGTLGGLFSFILTASVFDSLAVFLIGFLVLMVAALLDMRRMSTSH